MILPGSPLTGRGNVENTGEIFGNNGWEEASLVGQGQGCNE